MIIYRLVNSRYKDDLSGYGAFLYGGRWNTKGLYALYASEHISLAALEIVVNFERGMYGLRPGYHLLEIDVPETPILKINPTVLKKNWIMDEEYTRFMGDQFLQQRTHLLLQMPSAVIQEEYNFILNPMHTLFKKVKVKNARPYGLDSRLFG